MISVGIEVKELAYAYIHLMLGAKFGEDPRSTSIFLQHLAILHRTLYCSLAALQRDVK